MRRQASTNRRSSASMLVPGLGPHRVVGELVPVQVELAADRPRRVAFVDGTLRTEDRLTRTSADGDVNRRVSISSA